MKTNGIYKTEDYYIIDEKLIFNYDFNKQLDNYYEIIKNKKIESIYFSNYNNFQDCIIAFNEYKSSMMHNFRKSIFKKDIINLPENIKNLFLGKLFEGKLINLPENIETISFGDNFNNSVNNLPNSIKCLIFGDYFDKSVNKLPKKLKYLALGLYFDQGLDNLPKNLRHLILDGPYELTLNKLPRKLDSLVLPIKYDFRLNNLPPDLKILIFKGGNYTKKIIHFPNKLRFLCIIKSSTTYYLPSSIKNYYYSSTDYFSINRKKENKIIKNKKIHYKIYNLPNSLKNIILQNDRYAFRNIFFNKTVIEQFEELEKMSI
jgi:hypothetical protein